MTRTIQSRLLALVGFGVLAAAAVLSLLSRRALLDLEAALQQSQHRFADIVADALAGDVLSDEQALQGAGDAPFVDPGDNDDAPERRALAAAVAGLRLGTAVCFWRVGAAPGPCAPADAAAMLAGDAVSPVVARATAAARPAVTNGLDTPEGAGLAIVLPWHPERRRDVAVIEWIDLNDRRLGLRLRAGAMLVDGSGRQLAGGRQDTSRVVDASVGGTPWRVRVPAVTDEAAAAVSGFRTTSLWLSPALAGLAMLLGWGVAGSVRRPAAALVAAAERIASGDLSQPIPPAPPDEIGRLAGAIEEMRVGLKASRDAQDAWSAALEQRVAERTRELRRLTRQILSAQEDERRRVARELHDETSQLVAALAIRLDSLSALAAGDEASRLRDLRALVERMHEALHRVIANLRPSVLDDLGLAAAIEWLAEAQLSRQGIAVRCELRDLRDLRLAPDIETAAFRIVQEAITNVSRHAGADTVLIQGSRSDGWITIEIEDDGCGFRPEAVIASAESLRGIGLLGMRERVQLVGGRLVIDSAPGQGTRVALTVPSMEETAP